MSCAPVLLLPRDGVGVATGGGASNGVGILDVRIVAQEGGVELGLFQISI